MKKIHIIVSLLGIIFFCGISFYLAFYTPLWLDEQYSLLFVLNKTFSDLFISKTETHPGLYYALLKIILDFELPLSLIRLLSGAMPILLGWLALSQVKLHNKSETTYGVAISILILLNPYFIEFSWQIRMYGLLFLAVSLSLFTLTNYIREKSNRWLLLVLAILLIGQAVNYVFYIFSLGVVAAIIFQKQKKCLQKIGFFGIMSSVQLIVQVGGNLHQFSQLSWIDPISLPYLYQTYLKIIGLSTLSNYVLFQLILAFSIAFTVGFIIFHSKNKIYWLLLVGLPLLVITAAQVVIYLAQLHWLTAQVLPLVTFILPRSLLVVATPFYFLLAQDIVVLLLDKSPSIHKIGIAFISTLLGISWLLHSFQSVQAIASSDKLTSNKDRYILSQLAMCSEKEVFFYPPWSVVETVNQTNLYLTSKINYVNQKSVAFEQMVLRKNDKKRNASNYIVNFLKKSVPNTLLKDEARIYNYLQTNCRIKYNSVIATTFEC